MKQCIYRVFLLLMTVLLLTSCAEDPLSGDDPGGNGGDNTGGGVGNNFSLTMRIPLPEENSSTRSYTGISRGNTYGEILINGVRIALYGENNTVIHCWDLDIELGIDGSGNITVSGSDVLKSAIASENILVQIAARKLTRADYRMLVIVNPNDAVKTITEVGEPVEELDTPFDTEEDNSLHGSWTGVPGIISGGPAYFLMLNSQGLIHIKQSNFYDTPEKAEDNPVYAKVERAAARIDSEYEGPPDSGTRSAHAVPYGRFVMLLDFFNPSAYTDYDIPDNVQKCLWGFCDGVYDRETKVCSKNKYHVYGADAQGLYSDLVRYMVVTDFTWQPDIVNKKNYWLRHLTYKAGGSSMEVQGDIDRENFYAEDPNFSDISGTTGLNNEFRYITNSDFIYTDGTGSSPRRLKPLSSSSYPYASYWSWTDGYTEPVYIPENTMVKSDQKGDVASRVIFKAILRREKFKADGTDPDPVNAEPIGDFFVYKGGSQIIADYMNNNVNADGSIFYILRPEDIALYASGSAGNILSYISDGILEAIDQFKTDNPDFKFSDWANEGPAKSEKLIFYKNGEIYYQVPIEHFSVSEVGAGEYGRFGVVRNNWYKLNIQNILSMGEPAIPEAGSSFIETSSARSATGATSNPNSLIRTKSITF